MLPSIRFPLFLLFFLHSTHLLLLNGENEREPRNEPQAPNYGPSFQGSPSRLGYGRSSNKGVNESSGGNLYQTGSPGPGSPYPIPPLNPQPPSGSLIAYIHMYGITGYFIFTPGQSSPSLIKGRLATGANGEADTFRWKIFFKPNQPFSVSCSSAIIGHMLYDLTPHHGALPVDKDLLFPSSLKLTGEDSILGRTLVLESVKSGLRVCATILPATDKLVYEAKFHSPIAGLVRVIQTSARTGILAEYLMYSDGQRRDSLHEWSFISDNDPSWDARVQNEKNRCSSLIRNERIFTFDSKQVFEILVSTEMATLKGRSYQTIPPLKPLSSHPTVYMLLHDDKDTNKILACAPLNMITPKSAVANFDSDDIKGRIKITQETPFDPTVVSSDLDLGRPAFSYGIDVLPTIRRRKIEKQKCPNVKEIIFNPFHKDPEEVPPQGLGTTDQYAVGDLSGKYGTLHEKKRHQTTLLDFNLPLFGYDSVIGRAIVLYAPDGPAIGCANIDLEKEEITTAYATFDIPLQGQFIFRQTSGECHEDTYVYIEISKPDGKDVDKTYNHNWHIHQKPVKAGFEHLSSTECKSGGPHLNPFNTSTSCIYTRDCNALTLLRCEVGDSAGKLGQIDIPPYKSNPKSGEPEVGKYYFVDSDLQLCGPNKIIGRSVIIHERDFGAPRMTCANILEFKPKS